MTIDEIFNLATAGDGTLDPALAAQAGMPLEEFIAEKERRKAAIAEEQEQLNKRNAERSTGSMADADAVKLPDPTEEARQFMQDMEEAYHNTPAQQLEGQEALPGFEEPASAALDADTVKRNIGRVSFKVDYMKSPEDALTAYNAPAGQISEYLSRHFQQLVDEVARLTGADPEQIADKERRTPEQDQLLMETAGRMQIARINTFLNSKYMAAAEILEPLKGKYKDPTRKETYTAEELLTDFDPNALTVKDQTVLYFFAIHDEIKPTEAGKLTPEQTKELKDIYYQINDFCLAHENDTIETAGIPKEIFLFTRFIEDRHPAAGEAQKIAETIEEAATNLPRVITNRITKLTLPVDKVNSFIWSRSLPMPLDGNARILPLEVDTASKKNKRKGKPAIINVTLDFSNLDGVQIDRPLTPYDFRVMCAVGSLMDAGNTITSLSDIHEALGNTGRPSSAQLEKIEKSLTTMGATRIKINNEQEIQVNKGYPKYVYNGPMLLWDAIEAYIDNTLTDAAIRFFTLPPLYVFAKERDQITTVQQKVLNSPISKTEANLAIENYLLKEISHMKNNKRFNRKILLETLYERCDIKTRMQRNRAPEKIRTYLDHYKKTEFIKGYKEAEGSITILL